MPKSCDEGNALVFGRRARRLRGYVRGVVSHSLVKMVAEVEVRMGDNIRYENVGHRNIDSEECILSHQLTTPSTRFGLFTVTHLSQLRALYAIIIPIYLPEPRHAALRAPMCSTRSTILGTRGSTHVAQVTFAIQAELVASQS